jgi:hypothetical protein
LINYCGTFDTITPETGEIIYKKLDSITDNNPDFEDAYEMGALFISNVKPEMAIALLDKGCNNKRLDKNWKIPYYAAFISSHYLKNKDINMTIKYNSMALSRSSASELYILSSCIRATSQKILAAKKWQLDQKANNVAVADEKHAILCAWLGYINSQKRSEMGRGMRPASEIINNPKVDSIILNLASELKSNFSDNQDVLYTIEQAKELIFRGEHLCPHCLVPYVAGDKFCSSCGKTVEIFGTCQQCGAVKKGTYCSECGSK